MVLRTFRNYDQDEISVEELESVRALQTNHQTPSIYTPFTHELSEQEAQAFSRAGWRFIDLAKERELLREATRSAKVFLASDGKHLLLSEGFLVVQFKRELAVDAISQLLAQRGYRIQQRIPVSPNMYRVRPLDKERDAIEGTALFQALTEVIYAEPEFLEVIDGR